MEFEARLRSRFGKLRQTRDDCRGSLERVKGWEFGVSCESMWNFAQKKCKTELHGGVRRCKMQSEEVRLGYSEAKKETKAK